MPGEYHHRADPETAVALGGVPVQAPQEEASLAARRAQVAEIAPAQVCRPSIVLLGLSPVAEEERCLTQCGFCPVVRGSGQALLAPAPDLLGELSSRVPVFQKQGGASGIDPGVQGAVGVSPGHG